MFEKFIRHKILLIGATLTVMFSPTLLFIATMAWSESVFIVLNVLFIIILDRFLNDKNRTSSLLLLCLVGALVCLQRYGGIATIFFGIASIVIISSKQNITRRVLHAAILAIASLGPLFIWIIRNHNLTSSFFGGHLNPPHATWQQNVQSSLVTIGSWIWPGFPSFKKTVGSLFFLLLLICLSFSVQLFNQKNKREWTLIKLNFFFVLVYTSFLIVSASISSSPDLTGEPLRLLSPIFISIQLLIFAGVDDLLCLLEQRWNHKTLIQTLRVIICLSWLVNPVWELTLNICDQIKFGAGGFNTTVWRNSKLINWLENNPLNGNIYSNVPDAIYLLTGVSAQMSPRKSTDLKQWKATLPTKGKNYVVWSDPNLRDYLYDINDLAKALHLQEVKKLPDGNVWEIK